jgi:26S proteasome regulatory subunit N2
MTTRAKFSATASLGMIHASHVTEAMQLLEPYLPAAPTTHEGDVAPPSSVSPTGGYSEGGSLYALGLIHGSNVGSSTAARNETTQFIRSHLRISHANEVISHGAALGVGLTAMGSADLAIVNELKEVLDTDSAVAGEAAGYAIGMILVGTGAGNTRSNLSAAVNEEAMEIVAELKNYARETQHEKIIRGIAMGLALMNFGQEENADAAIEDMRSDRDPVMRYGAMYALALAYCGTSSNKAVRILLHTAVSDVSDDVRMAAVIGLAFVLFKKPERVPELVKLLLESFNPHVRYASCIAVGIAMAGSGDTDSIALLEPMLDDMTDYVRQGALIGTAMIYMQQSDTSNGRRIKSFREKLMTVVSEKHQSNLTKMGAILSLGIIDAGGRNCSLTLGSRTGFTKMSSAVGLALWLQHWHWYPMMHMFSVAISPTYTIGLNKDFKYPKHFEIICNAKPSMFAYPKKVEEKREEKKKRIETVTLSITAKEKARLARKRAKEGGSIAATDDAKADNEIKKTTDAVNVTTSLADKDAMDVDKKDDGVESSKKVKKKKDPEATSFRIGNPARITKAQSQFCTFDPNQRYHPVRVDEKPSGVIILTDSQPEEDEDVAAVTSPSLEPDGELPPPEPFLWNGQVAPPLMRFVSSESDDNPDKTDNNDSVMDDDVDDDVDDAH